MRFRQSPRAETRNQLVQEPTEIAIPKAAFSSPYSKLLVSESNQTISKSKIESREKRLPIGAGIAALLGVLSIPCLPHLAAKYSAFAMSSPYMCSISTSATKGIISDTFAQLVVEKKERLNARRTLAFALFGATYLGAYCHFKYDFLYTMLFGSAKSAAVIGMKMAVDMLISAPFIYFPTYYLFKGALFGNPLKEMRSYFTRDGFSMLKRYWAVWVPTTLVMWTAVPVHLRVPFLCAVSLIWQVVLSTRSYARKGKSSRLHVGQQESSGSERMPSWIDILGRPESSNDVSLIVDR